MMDFVELARACAPGVHPTTMAAVVDVESALNPYAIGVVGARLMRQPRNLEEAVATAQALKARGLNFSVGVAQVNRYNLARLGLDDTSAFDVCANLGAGARILRECFGRAKAKATHRTDQQALQAAFSCYYSGNFSRGFASDGAGQGSYVQRVLDSAARHSQAGPASK